MAMNTVPRYPDVPKWAGVQILPADTTTKKTIWTAPANGSKILALNVANDDSAAGDMLLWMTKGGVDYLLGMKTIALSAGFVTATPTFNWFDGVQVPGFAVDADGQRYMLMESGCVLKASMKVTVTAAKIWHITAYGQDF